MKNVLVILLFSIFFSLNAIAQVSVQSENCRMIRDKGKDVLLICKHINENDTSSSFVIKVENKDKCRDVLIEKWDTPKKNKASRVVWKDITIKGIDEKLTISIGDGIHTRKGSVGYFVPFKNEKEKREKIENLKIYEERLLSIRFSSSKKKNIITSTKYEKLIIELLMEEFKDIN